MTKITKEFTEALGFKLLSTYTSFATEYPVEGAKIQKIYDEDFKATCFKCYPIIADAGVDPLTYVPKQPVGGIKTELRKLFPVKPVQRETPKEEPTNDRPIAVESDTEEDEETLSNLTQVRMKQPAPLKPASPKQCPNCMRYITQLKIDQESLGKMKKQHSMMADIILDKSRLIDSKNQTIDKLKQELDQTRRELLSLKNDPEFMSILEYQRKKRKQ
jgi:hypothetical protein